MMDIKEFLRRLNYIKNLYQLYNIQVKSGEGMAKMLAEAEKIAKGEIAPHCTDDKLRFAIESFHYTWTLAETLETCVNEGWGVSNHLKQITTGTIDYGDPYPGCFCFNPTSSFDGKSGLWEIGDERGVGKIDISDDL